MSAYPLPPNPCLVAIILVVRFSSDPSIVFHYPPKPGEDNSRFKDLFKENAAGDESSSSSSSEHSHESSTEAPNPQQDTEIAGKKDSPPDGDAFGSASPDKSNGFNSNLKWNDLFGYPSAVLAKLLTPAASGNKKRFEVGLNDKVMIGRPLIARPDGTWKKVKQSKKTRRSSSRSHGTAEKAEKAKKDQEAVRLNKSKRLSFEEKANSEALRPEILTDSQSECHDLKDSEDIANVHKPVQNEKKNLLPKSKKSLAMFNLVYVLQPPPLEYHIRVGEMYDYIVRKLSKALKWEQSRSNYVANEAALISSVTKANERMAGDKKPLGKLYSELLAQSSLARAISNLYNSVSSLRIAHLSLTPSLSLSLQIPIATSISVLPTPLSPQLPGLWLTTADSMPADDVTHNSNTHLGSHFTLLLLSDLNSILIDVNAAKSPITEALTHYLHVTRPTKSFHQISQTSGIPLPDIQFLASHLIYWRRARAIPPLHQRDTYIVSANADMRKLSSAASTFAKVFPALPSLPHMLSILSSRLRPYSSLIPSKDHKEAYMDILAWLMRGGWVTQLRTFAWVRVPIHIKETVDSQKPVKESDKSPSNSTTDGSESTTDDSDASSSMHLDVPHSHSRSASPASSTHTTLPISQPTSHHSPNLMSNPSLASDLPSRHLFAISKFILESQGTECQSAWGKCVQYFDGRHALETIPVREGWKRKRVKEMLDGWVELGVLVRGRHW